MSKKAFSSMFSLLSLCRTPFVSVIKVYCKHLWVMFIQAASSHNSIASCLAVSSNASCYNIIIICRPCRWEGGNVCAISHTHNYPIRKGGHLITAGIRINDHV